MLVQSGKIHDPLPHLELWLMCRRLQGDSMARLLPDAGGVLDQNYELTWAFGIIDDQYHTELELKKNFEQKSQDLEALRQQLLQRRSS